MTYNDYEKQSIDFMSKTNSSYIIEKIKFDYYFNDDKQKRNIYKIYIYRGGRHIEFTFGQSIVNTEKNIKPTIYDILASVEKYEYENFNAFCDEYGYNNDSIKAKSIYDAHQKQYIDLKTLYSDEEIEELRDIN